jgi:hypothetical protein
MSNNMKFSLSVPRGPLPVGSRIIINMELESAESSPTYVNARFSAVPRVGEVWLTIRRGGQPVLFQLRVRLAPLKNSDFILLNPGERVIAGYEITKGYRLNEPGDYEISAEYVAESVPPELSQERVFQGRLRSSTVILSLS